MASAAAPEGAGRNRRRMQDDGWRAAPPSGRSRAHGVLVVAALLGPALLLAAIGWWSWQRVRFETAVAAVRTIEILDEDAEGLLRGDRLVLDHIGDRVAGLDRAQFAEQEAALHGFLKQAILGLPGVRAAYLADAAGEVQVSSRIYPVRASLEQRPARVNVQDSDFFAAARKSIGMVVGGPGRSRIDGKPIIAVARPLRGPDGEFRGVATLVLSPHRLDRFWSGVVEPGDTVALVAADGTILARHPEMPPAAETARPHLSARLTAGLAAAEAGAVDVPVSPIDGVARRVWFHKLAGYPLYVTYGVDRANLRRNWLTIFAAFAALAFAAAVALLLAARAVIRHSRREAAALARAEALFRNAPAAMHALDGERRIVDVNQRWLDLLGYRREEVIGRPVTDLHAAPAQAEPLARWQRGLHAGGSREVERRFVKRSGEIVDVAISSTVEHARTGAFQRIIGVVTDLTARRQAEKAARSERQLSELLIANGPEGIIGFDREFRYRAWNPAMEAISGIPRSVLIGRDLFAMFPDLLGTPVEAALRGTTEGRRTSVRDFPFAFPDSGRRCFCHADVSPLYDAEGAIVGGLMFVRDITEIRRAEEALRQAQKMEAVGQLTGGIAHDFNNLLTAVLGSLDLIVGTAGVPDRVRQLAGSAARAAERGARLTASLLAFSRRQTLRSEIVDINALVEEFETLARQAVGESGRLSVALEAARPHCRADSAHLQSALLNLVINARDALGASGGEITVETRNQTLDDAALAGNRDAHPGAFVALAVRDNGSGMAPETVAQAFEPFFTTKEVGQGSGLGLSQVYGFAHQSAGHVTLDSAPGRGTVVTLFLPAAPAPAAARPAAADGAAVPGGAATLLVVEDDAEVRGFTATALRGAGFAVLEAANAGAALALLEGAAAIDLLFTDIMLPEGGSGTALAGAAQRSRPGLPVLLTTGYTAAALERHGVGASDAPMLRKPYRIPDLIERIHAALRAARERPLAAGDRAPA